MGTELNMSTRQWGIRMQGAGEGLEHLLRQHVAVHPKPEDRAYTLVEIGSAGCVSLRAFADILSETLGVQAYRWRAIGFDLTPGKAWSLDMVEVERSFVGLPRAIVQLSGDQGVANYDGMSLYLADDPRAYLRDHFSPPIDFAFIDGCHGKCAGNDFLAIESKVAPGGIVAFHDYGQLEQGEDWQPHCNEFINVRTYVHRLGLTQPTNRLRKGWRWVGEIPGSRRFGGDGNSVAVVQRTEEALEADAPGVD